ncbi:hypothetical protein GC163_23685 [bacterium]|nr:hypothetical protein [bacterium]
MLMYQLAVVSQTKSLKLSEVVKVSAALQKQVSRDFGPIWSVNSTVDAFDRLEDVPIGYWPVIVSDNIHQPGAAGVHMDKDGQPFALVQMSEEWALTASHEVLEMLADPFGNRLIAGQSPDKTQGRVEFLVEVCDPSEAREFGYTLNGILLSDFYTPKYFDPVVAAGVRYSFTGAITKPRQVLKGGYLSWHDPVSDHWFQETFFRGAKSRIRDLGIMSAKNGSFRSQIDISTNLDSLPTLKGKKVARGSRRTLTAAMVAEAPLADTYQEATGSRASRLQSQIEALLASEINQ